MYSVTIVRKDSVTEVEREVKHALWKGTVLTLVMGEHGNDRVYEWWPREQIDHVVVKELRPGGLSSGVIAAINAARRASTPTTGGAEEGPGRGPGQGP